MESKKYQFTVNSEEAGTRLDVFLTNHIETASRKAVQDAINNGKVSIAFAKSSKKVKPSYIICESDIISIDITSPPEKSDNLAAEDIKLDIVYEDEDILIINKPIGISVHPGAGIKSGTVANAVKFLLKENISHKDDNERPGIVHRLDKDTSGLLIIAKNDTAHHRLSSMFERRLIRKQYIALNNGIFEFDEDRIDAPIERDTARRERFRVGYGQSARNAITDYKVLKRIEDKKQTLVLFSPLTGRTHQIRVHSHYIGHPIVGDKKYNHTQSRNYKRLCLHAFRLSFKHPLTGNPIDIKSNLPDFVIENRLDSGLILN